MKLSIRSSNLFNYYEISLFISMILFVVQPTPSPAQSRNPAQITGQVLDAKTGEPLPAVNVFLAGTSLGDATDKDGYYAIQNIPPGTYELVVSMMGYKVRRKKIELAAADRRKILFNLKPEILQGEEVTVTAPYPKEWRKNLKIFVRAFFGLTKFAGQCKILNAEVLDFEYDKDSGIFRAFANKPLIFINRALGYEVTFTMEKFDVEVYDGEIYEITSHPERYALFKIGKLNCLGQTQFKELLAKDEDEEKKWQKNRRIAYNGSLRHFLKAFIEGRLKQEGFEIWDAKKISYTKRYDYKVKADTLLRPASDPTQFILAFPKYLHVEYAREEDYVKSEIENQLLKLLLPQDPALRNDSKLLEGIERTKWRIYMESQYQESWLKIRNGKEIVITVDGLVMRGPSELSATAWWGWGMGAAEWMPADYVIQHRMSFITSLG